MVVHQENLKKLVEFHGREHPVVSLYLNLTPPRVFLSELNSLIHTKENQLKESGVLNDEQLHRLTEVFANITNHVRGLGRGLAQTRLLTLFASPEGLWQEFRLPVALPSRLVVEGDPYIRPLSLLLDEFSRYCVLVVDVRKARIFSLYLGEIEEHLGIFEDDVPSKVSAGGWAGLQEKRIQRHIEDHIHRHLKHCAQRTWQFFREQGFDLLVVGGPKDGIIPRLLDHLSSGLRERVAGEFSERPESNLAVLKEKALEVARRWERQAEERLIARLLDENRVAGKGVLGLEPTVAALMRGQVHTLLVQQDFSAQGLVCRTDHFLSTSVQHCPICQGAMESTADLVDEMIEEGIAQEAEVEHIFTQHQSFSSHGIGALLRFSL